MTWGEELHNAVNQTFPNDKHIRHKMPPATHGSPGHSDGSDDVDMPLDSDEENDRPGPSRAKKRGDYGKSLGKRGRANGKDKDVSEVCMQTEPVSNLNARACTLGKPHTNGVGTMYRRMRTEGWRERWRVCWQGVEGRGGPQWQEGRMVY
jgi:hypothetical protein